MCRRPIIFGHETSYKFTRVSTNSAALDGLSPQNVENKQKVTNLQNPEVLDAREVHFSDSGDVVSVQIPTERNTGVTNPINKRFYYEQWILKAHDYLIKND